MITKESREYAARLRAQGLSAELTARALKRRFSTMENVEALAVAGHIPEPGIWSRANVPWGFGHRSPERGVGNSWSSGWYPSKEDPSKASA